MDTRKATILGLVTALAAPIAMADEQQDREFLTAAIAGDLAEIELGKLAQEKGQSQQVRDFGEQLADDHADALEDAKDAADEIGLMPPRQPTAEAQETYDHLSQLSGTDFDREFAEHMIMDHEKHIAAFKVQAGIESHSESAASEHARETLPALEEHLAMAESLGLGPLPR